MKKIWSDLKTTWQAAASVWRLCRKHGADLVAVKVQPILAEDLATLLALLGGGKAKDAGFLKDPEKDPTLN